MFHSKDGWFFSRLSNGKVAVEKHQTANEKSGLREYVVFTPEEWASIVASVSKDGEFGGRWQQALSFHGKDKNTE